MHYLSSVTLGWVSMGQTAGCLSEAQISSAASSCVFEVYRFLCSGLNFGRILTALFLTESHPNPFCTDVIPFSFLFQVYSFCTLYLSSKQRVGKEAKYRSVQSPYFREDTLLIPLKRNYEMTYVLFNRSLDVKGDITLLSLCICLEELLLMWD